MVNKGYIETSPPCSIEISPPTLLAIIFTLNTPNSSYFRLFNHSKIIYIVYISFVYIFIIHIVKMREREIEREIEREEKEREREIEHTWNYRERDHKSLVSAAHKSFIIINNIFGYWTTKNIILYHTNYTITVDIYPSKNHSSHIKYALPISNT